jgi:hypothetical protein
MNPTETLLARVIDSVLAAGGECMGWTVRRRPDSHNWSLLSPLRECVGVVAIRVGYARGHIRIGHVPTVIDSESVVEAALATGLLEAVWDADGVVRDEDAASIVLAAIEECIGASR